MECLLKWLDEVDDLMDVFRVQTPAVLATTALIVASCAVLGTLLLLGSPDLFAAN